MKKGDFSPTGPKIELFRVLNEYPVPPSHEESYFESISVVIDHGVAKKSGCKWPERVFHVFL